MNANFVQAREGVGMDTSSDGGQPSQNNRRFAPFARVLGENLNLDIELPTISVNETTADTPLT